MKLFNLLPFVFSVCLFFSCSNPDFAYNESATAVFLREMKNIDELHQSFANLDRVFLLDGGEQVSLKAKAEIIENRTQDDMQYLNGLQPPAAAKEFHQAVNTYFSKIAHYGKTAQTLLSVDSADRKTIYLQLVNEYEAIDKMPDQVLAIQKAYLKEVGLPAK